jgi:hypothetical protein
MVLVTFSGAGVLSTCHHPWWVIRGEALAARPQPEHVPDNPKGFRGDGRWVDAIDLRVGDRLLLRSGEQSPITELTIQPTSDRVYNLHVEELHCYAVGIAQVLVHNNCADGGGQAGKIIGISDQDANALGNWLKKIEVDGQPAVESVEAFGSRAGSTFRGRPPSPGSDLDVFVTIRTDVANTPEKLLDAQAQIDELAGLFGKAKGVPVEVSSEIDALAEAAKSALLQTPFIPLGD